MKKPPSPPDQPSGEIGETNGGPTDLQCGRRIRVAIFDDGISPNPLQNKIFKIPFNSSFLAKDFDMLRNLFALKEFFCSFFGFLFILGMNDEPVPHSC